MVEAIAMKNALGLVFYETVLMERNCARLYRLLSQFFSEDETFWSELAHDEEYHAMNIQRAQDYYKDALFAVEAFDLLNIQKLNHELTAMIAHYERSVPSRQKAFLNALKLENLSGECYFQITINKPDSNPAIDLFRGLVDEEVNHAQRIEIRMKMPVDIAS